MRLRLGSLLFSVCVAISIAPAQSLTGVIRDYNNVPVPNVNVILSNGAPLGTTDATGTFLITGLRNRVYTIQLDPHTNFLDAQQFDFAVSGASTLGTITLQPAMPVTATFVGPTGAGLLGVNMNAYLSNGTKLFTPHDGSDALGNVTIGVPVNQPLIIRAVPPVGSNLVAWETPMTVTTPVALGTIQLPQGYAVTGNVVDTNTLIGIGGCELITTNMLTGQVVLQLNKLSAAVTGSFSLLLGTGIYEIDVVPPLGNLHAARAVLGTLVLGGPVNMGLVKMQPGATLTGQVLGPSGAVANADIDVYTAGNDKLFTTNDNTTATGVFSVIVPFGAGVTYQVRVDPQPGTGLVGTRTASFPFTAGTNIGPINLSAGVPMNLTILDANNLPVAGANLNLHDPVTGAEIITPGDISDALGQISATVPLGTYNVTVAAPQGSVWHTASLPGYVISGAVTQTINLALKTVMCNVQGLGIVTIPNGGDIFLRFSFSNPTVFNVPGILDGYVVTPDGAITPWVPQLFIDFFPLFGMSLDFQIPTPPMAPANFNRLLRFVVRIRDYSGVTLDEAYLQYVVGG